MKLRDVFLVPLAALPSLFPVRAEIPDVPFSGAYGATSGAGSLSGWDRLGGDNPATLGAPAWSVSAAGYAPFGLDDMHVVEVETARDAPRWGASFGVRTLSAGEGVSVSLFRGTLAARLGERWSGGGALRFGVGGATGRDGGVGGGLGMLWRPRSFASLGAAWEDGLIGFGADCGSDFGGAGGNAASWRYSIERYFGAEGEFRHGFGLRLHSLLSIYAGFAPARETASLGVRFGAGSWEGFSALRRHAALGGTPVQGVRWTRATGGEGGEGENEKSRAPPSSRR
ncbi:MAG TPA: hypothetical protein VHO02_09095 [Fibrobacteria bacterium]|jgi:hypothetical protein|nr:hypothetical protein [Fibrobacteria bacterium]